MLTKLTYFSVALLWLSLTPIYAQEVSNPQQELTEVVESMCVNATSGLFVACEVRSSDAHVFFGRFVAFGFLEGQFTGSEFEEALLAFTVEGTDGETAFTLLQKRKSGWYAPHAEKLESFSDVYVDDQLRGHYLMVLEGGERAVAVSAEGALLANEIVGELFTIRAATYTQNETHIETLVQVPRQSNWWNCHERAIPELEPFATFEGIRQIDLNSDGLDDIALEIDVRYWRDTTPNKEFKSFDDCDEAFERLSVERRQVTFLFDGQSLREGQNVAWLRNLYNSFE